MLIHWIWLATRRGLGDRAKQELAEHFQSAEDVFFADPETVGQITELSEDGVRSLQDKDLSQAEKILDQCREKNLSILTYRDAAYPARLRNISDPPMVLYCKGRIPELDSVPVIGVVGTRHASLYGLTTAKRMGYQIAKCGGTVVSGMAYGIDGVAMEGALTAGGNAVGVLGCGADLVYPRSNANLFRDTERYGCILSEFPPETPPLPGNFPKRNRIISGLSCGVLVVEAPEKSGALITARQAADQGRDVFVIPGNIDVPTCVGSNRLLRDGAIAVGSGWDILSEYVSQFPGKIRRETAGTTLTADPQMAERTPARVAEPVRPVEKKHPPKEKVDKLVIDNGENRPYIDLNEEKSSFTPTERTILEALRSGQRLVDDVIAETELPAGTVLATLTMLEVKGVVQRLPGRHIALK